MGNPKTKVSNLGMDFFFFLPKVVYSTFVALKEREESNGFTKLTAFHLSK